MALKSGDYFLFAFDLENRPIGAKPILHHPNQQVYLQPPGTEAYKWHLEYVAEYLYVITSVPLGGRQVKDVNGDVQVVDSPPPPKFLWAIGPVIREPPPPEPLYSICIAGVYDKHWFIQRPDDPFAEVPVIIVSELGSAIAIVPADK